MPRITAKRPRANLPLILARKSRKGVRVVKLIKYWLPVVIYAIIIFYFSSIPGQDIPHVFPYQDIVFHVIEYALFALLINRALRAGNPAIAYSRRFLWVIVLVIIYAITDEFHQSFVPNRIPSLFDIVSDGIGACIANLIYR